MFRLRNQVLFLIF